MGEGNFESMGLLVILYVSPDIKYQCYLCSHPHCLTCELVMINMDKTRYQLSHKLWWCQAGFAVVLRL